MARHRCLLRKVEEIDEAVEQLAVACPLDEVIGRLAIEYGGEAGRGIGGQFEVRRGVRPAIDVDPQGMEVAGIFLIPKAKIKAGIEAAGACEIDHCPHRKQDRNRADWQGWIVTRAARCPAPEGLDDGLGLQAPFGRLIDLDMGRRRQSPLYHQAALFKLGQTLAQDICADSRQVCAKLRKAARSEHQFTQDQQGPALADQLESMSSAASVVVGPFRGPFERCS